MILGMQIFWTIFQLLCMCDYDGLTINADEIDMYMLYSYVYEK